MENFKCQTVLSKNLGPFKEWRSRLNLSKDAKYNMIHFTPIQELGSSNSAYSLRNQDKVNPSFGASLDDIKKEVDYMDRKLGIKSITDIVLNHTADDSGWIISHPECGYNLKNSPHLRPAFLLDSAFIWLMKDLTSGLLRPTDKLSAMIQTEQDIAQLGILLRSFYVPQLRIWELFMVDIGEAMSKFSSLLRGDNLKIEYTWTRNGARLVCIPNHVTDHQQLNWLLKTENQRKRAEVKGILEGAINNALSAMRYERLNPAGPYYGQPVEARKPIVAPYFTHTPLDSFTIEKEESLMFSSGEQFMAHNGWVMGNPTEDFAEPDSQVMLKRELVAWGDCIKLRYGDEPKDAPYLWKHMRKYVEMQAKVFHGFRLDNCHSTPLHVAEYFLGCARSVRPKIYIIAELFTSSESVDNIYVERLGITALIRESMMANNARELGRLIHRFGGKPVGSFQGEDPEQTKMAGAIFYDQTHDNESPILKRSAYDIAPTAAIISMAACATGSTRGYDEMVPHHISVVTEDRLYPINVDQEAGILPLRRLLNGQLQRELIEGFSEIFVDQVNEDVIAITRHNPTDGRSIVLIARTHFSEQPRACYIRPIEIEGQVSRIIFESQCFGDPTKYTRDEKFINGLPAFKTKILNQDCPAQESKLAEIEQIEEGRVVVRCNEFKFLPSSVLAFEIIPGDRRTQALNYLNQWSIGLDLNLNDANFVLFRCAEEAVDEEQLKPYALPDFCQFTYCGLYGLMYYMDKVRKKQDLAHPLAANLRAGNWLSQYIVSRLKSRPSTRAIAEQLELALNEVDILPRGMKPKYFDLVVSKFYAALLDNIYSRMSPFVFKGSELAKLLSLSSVALVGECKSAQLPYVEYSPSIAAGLPHFATGYMRNWGRDTFIALRGLLLLTGRFADAKNIILSYARTLKNGLIPNLLDGGKKPRYNCRDAVWWWLYSIKEYTKIVPGGAEILRHKLPSANGKRLCDVMQDALECHFKGMDFIEENAGRQIDEHMTEEGFNITFGVDRKTGFVFGGNRWNCGTWMDKMGSSEKAGNKGKPASPRDVSAVEIVGLCMAVVSWLDEMFKKGRTYPFEGVECLYDNTIILTWSWKKWAGLIKANFEDHFYISPESKDEMINKRGIYKDTLGATLVWQDFQLRPNFLIAMVVAPELFDKDHARTALEVVTKHLCGPLGMKTLDPSDWNYCGDYDNGNDSDDPKVAHGYNYHQGPEWLWLTGYYIRAAIKFGCKHHKVFDKFQQTLLDTPWLGLPELTCENGKFCRDSCPIQAWSVGTALEALHETK